MRCPDCHRQTRVGYFGPICRHCKIIWLPDDADPDEWEVRQR